MLEGGLGELKSVGFHLETSRTWKVDASIDYLFAAVGLDVKWLLERGERTNDKQNRRNGAAQPLHDTNKQLEVFASCRIVHVVKSVDTSGVKRMPSSERNWSHQQILWVNRTLFAGWIFKLCCVQYSKKTDMKVMRSSTLDMWVRVSSSQRNMLGFKTGGIVDDNGDCRYMAEVVVPCKTRVGE